MPPKKKLSQAEKDAIKAEEERLEAEKLAAEVKRLEEERLRKEEEERKLKAAQAEFRKQEIETLTEEIAKGRLEDEEFDQRLAEMEAKKAANLEWDKFTTCSVLPDEKSESDINTFISISGSELPTALSEALAGCVTTEAVVKQVRKQLAGAHAAGDSVTMESCEEKIDQLRQTSAAKLNAATLHLVNHADMFQKEELVMEEIQDAGLKVGIWANVIIKAFRGPVKPITFKDIGLQVDIPKALNLQHIAVRATYYPYDPVSFQLSEPSPDMILGGVMSVELMYLPPAPKVVKPGWILRTANVLTSELQRMPFGDDPGAVATQQPLRVNFHVPGSVYVVPNDDERKIVVWDAPSTSWTTDGVSQEGIDYNEETRSLRFQTYRSGFFALVQSRAASLPFSSWLLEPAIEVVAPESDILFDVDADEEGCLHYTLVTKSITVKIQIKADACQLLEPKIDSLYLKSMLPGELLYALRDAGINVMPIDADAQYALFPPEEAPRADGSGGGDPVPVECKTSDLEKKITQDVSRVAASFDVASSRWNRRVGKHRSVFRVRETSVYTGGNEETFDYDMYLMEADSESCSARDAPDVGSLSAPGLKCSTIQQSEELPPAPVIETSEESEPSDENKEAIEDNEDSPAAEDADAPVVEEGKTEEDIEGEEKAEDAKPAEPAAPKEVFKDSRKEGTNTNVFLKNALNLRSSEEASERVNRASPQLVKTIGEILTLTRPFSFS